MFSCRNWARNYLSEVNLGENIHSIYNEECGMENRKLLFIVLYSGILTRVRASKNNLFNILSFPISLATKLERSAISTWD